MKKFILLFGVIVSCFLVVEVVSAEEGVKTPVVEKKKEEQSQVKGMKKSDSSDWGVSYSARVVFKGTEEESNISGRADFVQTGDGLQTVVSLSNVTPPGKHGIHIHENGSCADGGKAAGGHFNPVGTPHGLLPKDGQGKAHAGDMGNILIDDKGKGTLVIFMPGLSLTEGHNNVAGKAVILHAKEDDFGQPTGNAGGRIACGEIILNQ